LKLSAAADGSRSYTYAELKPSFDTIEKQATRIRSVAAANRTSWEAECFKLRNALVIYDRLKNSLQPNSVWQNETPRNPGGRDFAVQVAQYQRDLRAGVAEALGAKEGKPEETDPARARRMDDFARPFVAMSRGAMFAMVPVPGQGRARDRWQNPGEIIGASLRTGQMSSAIAMLAGMSSGFARGDAAAFNEQVAKYRQWLTERKVTAALNWARYEVFSITFQPFVRALTIYLVALVLLAASRLSGLRELSRAAINLIVLAFVVHTVGLYMGMMLGGRSPFANLYDGIFATGWAVVLIAGIAELRWRNGIGTTTAAVAGLVTLAVGLSLGSSGVAEFLGLAPQTSFWLPLAAAAIVAASCLAPVRDRSRATDQAMALGVTGKAIGSAA